MVVNRPSIRRMLNEILGPLGGRRKVLLLWREQRSWAEVGGWARQVPNTHHRLARRRRWPERTQKGPFSAYCALGRPPQRHEVGKRRAERLPRNCLGIGNGYFKAMRPLATTAGVSPPGCLTLLEQEWNCNQCRYGIEPCDMEHGV